jgi:hypothetical protein
VAERLEKVQVALAEGPLTAFELVSRVHGTDLTPMTANWWLAETLSYLVHLERTGRVRRIADEPERWVASIP